MILFILVLISILVLAFLLPAGITQLPFIPTPMSYMHDAIKEADIKKGDIVMDLGSGDGRFLIAAAKRGATAIGWEINPFLVLYTSLRAYFAGVSDRVTIHCGNFLHADVHNADVIFLFVITKYLPKVEEKLQKEMKEGTKVIAYVFALSHMKPYKTIHTSCLSCYKIQ